MFIIRLFYVILLIACIVFYIMYLWDFALVLLITMLAVPVFLFISLLIAKFSIEVDFRAQDNCVQKNNNFPLFINIANKSIFPIGKAEAFIEYRNAFNDKPTQFIFHLPIQALNEQNVIFKLNSRFCGIVTVSCTGLYIYDPLRLFRFKVGCNSTIRLSVLPESHEISGDVSYSDRENFESNVYSEYKSGDDPSEIFDLRSYNAGDKLNRIHWKLSSKKDEFIVKEYSMPIDFPCSILIDLKCTLSDDYSLAALDTIIETAYSLSSFLLENEKPHSIIFYSCNAKAFIEEKINSEDTLGVTIRKLIRSLDNNQYIASAYKYLIEWQNASLSSFIFVSSDTNSETLNYIDENIDADFKNAFIVIPSAEEIGNADDSLSTLNITPVIVGKISSSISDIEV